MSDTQGIVATVGTFDGVHRGHSEVLRALKQEASIRGLEPVVFTFDRHPLETIAPERAPRLIMTEEERGRHIRNEDIRTVHVPFTRELSRLTAAEWMKRLRDRYGAKAVVIGYDNKFGSDGRTLTFEDYRRLGQSLGMDVIEAPEMEGFSSSAVRKAVAEGQMTKAREILGRPFYITGEVIKGRQLGRTIGVPTANVEPDSRQLIPASGVYRGSVETGGKIYKAVINVGSNPTVSESGSTRIETHLIGFSGNLYGREIKITFDDRLRDEKKFESLEALKLQISHDIEALKQT